MSDRASPLHATAIAAGYIAVAIYPLIVVVKWNAFTPIEWIDYTDISSLLYETYPHVVAAGLALFVSAWIYSRVQGLQTGNRTVRTVDAASLLLLASAGLGLALRRFTSDRGLTFAYDALGVTVLILTRGDLPDKLVVGSVTFSLSLNKRNRMRSSD